MLLSGCYAEWCMLLIRETRLPYILHALSLSVFALGWLMGRLVPRIGNHPSAYGDYSFRSLLDWEAAHPFLNFLMSSVNWLLIGGLVIALLTAIWSFTRLMKTKPSIMWGIGLLYFLTFSFVVLAHFTLALL